ncbi:TolC family protein [Tenacibaculum sp. SG-28]|uniref:TolC family protein n=1 Tax=Tenacibaculum sp. SG-28 TaxID=754426 RepID=UPI000CF482BD|nr:TolC family protein [Tenacibaculum sp. SG-28]PQJ23035.1 hypothetical protein BSU00_01855 [Tenacibaculum sp. SG-28]
MLLKQAEILIANSRKRLDKEQLRVQKAIQLGLGVPYDRDKIVLAKLELQSKNIEVKGKQEVLKSKIALLTGFSLEVIESISFIPEPAISLREDYTVQNKNELKALQSFNEAQEYLIKKEKGSYFPKVGVSIGLTYVGLFGSQIETEVLPVLDEKLSLDIDNLGLQPIFTAGIGLQWGIFDGLERSHKIKIAKIEKAQLENKLSDAEEKLDLLLTNAQHQYTAEVAKLEVAYQQEHVAKNNLVKAQKQYALGLISVTERLASENDYVKAKLHTVESLVNQRTSAVKLYIASGALQQNIRVK